MKFIITLSVILTSVLYGFLMWGWYKYAAIWFLLYAISLNVFSSNYRIVKKPKNK